MLKRIFATIILFLFICSPRQAKAQEAEPSRPVYVVESGDTFYSIALKFGVSVDDLVAANPEIDPNMMSVGAEVVIPGLEGVRGKLLTSTIPLGESLRALSIRNQITEEQIAGLNKVTSPAEVFAGASLIVPQVDQAQPPQSRYLLGEGQSLFALAVQHNLNPWLLAELNQQGNTWGLLPGEAIFDQPTENGEQVNLISPVIKELKINPLPIRQGETAVISITATQPIEWTGSLAGHELAFFPTGENTYVALQGVHAMADAGIYPFTLNGRLQDGTNFFFEQMVILQPLGYIQEKIDGVDPTTMDPAVTKPEDERVKEVVSRATPTKYWDGLFGVPGYDPNWITSTFGNRRSYNGSGFIYYHTGLDYGGGTGLPIKSPAAGVVVFAEPLTVRGNATIIDHGWGVFSGFWHQSEIQVNVGDWVEAGQVIGLVGGTGRITGPHLHWEVWVNGVQVNPISWLETVYP